MYHKPRPHICYMLKILTLNTLLVAQSTKMSQYLKIENKSVLIYHHILILTIVTFI